MTKGSHYSVIFCVAAVFGFSNLINYFGDCVRNNFVQPGTVFQKADRFSNQVVNVENFGRYESEIGPSFQITDTIIITGTATIPPLPTYTLIFPETTAETELFQTHRQPIEKQTSPQYWITLQRFWPILLLAVIWIILGLWFVFSQMIIK